MELEKALKTAEESSESRHKIISAALDKTRVSQSRCSQASQKTCTVNVPLSFRLLTKHTEWTELSSLSTAQEKYGVHSTTKQDRRAW